MKIQTKHRKIFILLLFIGIGTAIVLWFGKFPESFSFKKDLKKLPNLYFKQYGGKPASFWNWNDSVKYVGGEACKECHPEQYASYMKTGMGKSFGFATKQRSKSRFGDSALIYDKYNDFYYKPYWDNENMMLVEFRLKGGDTVFKHIEKMDYIVGSGHHTNSHIYNTNGYLDQIPATFYVQKSFWDSPPGFEGGYSSRFGRMIGLECLACHNSLPTMVKGSENKYTNVPQGISCERCHGPGELHCRLMREGKVVDKSKFTDSSIVTSGKLAVELQMDVCTRCHLQGNAILNEGKSFYDFIPGMRLSDVMSTFLPQYTGEAGFLMASHSPRMVMSKCYTESNKNPNIDKQFRPYKHKDAFTCLSCHSPHTSVFDEEKNHFIKACVKCHNGKDHTFCTTPENKIREKKNNCIVCHMPTIESIDIPNITFTDHYIRKPISEKEKKAPQDFIKLYCANNPNLDSLTLAKAYLFQFEKFEKKTIYLNSAKSYLKDIRFKDIDKNFEALVHWAYLKNDFKQMLIYVSKFSKQTLLNNKLNKDSWDNQNAWTCYRIGEAFVDANKYNDAYDYYKKATTLAPYVLEFFNKLAGVCLHSGNIEEAKANYEYIINENPKFVAALSNLGYIYMLKGNSKKAGEYYDKALALDPDYEQALLNKTGLYLSEQKVNEARELLIKILKKNPANVKAKEILSQIVNL